VALEFVDNLTATRDDPISAVDVTADEVLQEVIAVEAATALSELGQPMARYPQRCRES